MAIVVGIRFRDAGKVYYFDPGTLTLDKGDRAIVETARGMECGLVTMGNRDVPDGDVVSPLKRVIRKATPADEAHVEENERRRTEAFAICEKKIAEHKMDMKLVDVEYTFDNSKILFYFTADGRVDFRELVKDLASIFRTRIELRQIGVRDEAKMLGGLGICGRPFCCAQFLGDFQPVSIKMAKEQGLSLNPVKISGSCGRLMCCLKYEQEAYEDLIRVTPRVGALVSTPEGRGIVTEQNLVAGSVKVRPENNPEAVPRTFAVADVQALAKDRPRPERTEPAADAPADERPRNPRPNRPAGDARSDRRPDAPLRANGGSRPPRKPGVPRRPDDRKKPDLEKK